MPARGVAGVDSPSQALTVAEVLRFGLREYARHNRLPRHHWTVLNAITACRTIALGGQRYQCQSCGREHFVFHSCRNRHCPTCQGVNSQLWLSKQQEVLLPVSYFHTVFTLPHCLNHLIEQNQGPCYQLLFQSASSTLLEFGRNNLGVQLGVTAVLHTWSQSLLDHYHLHCIVPGGGISLDGQRWIGCSRKFLFAVQALSIVFRAKFRDGLQQLYARGRLKFEGKLQPLADAQRFQQLVKEATASPWVVYSKRPFAGPRQVLAYLSRYTHRVGISNRRLVELNRQQRTVCFRWKDYAHAGRRKLMTLAVDEFIRRLRLHILPPRFVKIRHYGWLSNRNRKQKNQCAKDLLNVKKTEDPPAERQSSATTAPEPLFTCPFCGRTTLSLIQTIAPVRPKLVPQFDSS